MGTYFLDSSAIVKRYVFEHGQSFVLDICDPNRQNDLYISQIALIEVVASFCRKTRESSLSIADRDVLIEAFKYDARKGFAIQVISNSLLASAANLCRLYRLRAYDAVQLASAIRLRNKAESDRAPIPIFVSADSNLADVAFAEGLVVENPNNYD